MLGCFSVSLFCPWVSSHHFNNQTSWEKKNEPIIFACTVIFVCLSLFFFGGITHNNRLWSFSASAVCTAFHSKIVQRHRNIHFTSSHTYPHMTKKQQWVQLRLPLISFLGGLAKQIPGKASTLWYNMCFNSHHELHCQIIFLTEQCLHCSKHSIHFFSPQQQRRWESLTPGGKDTNEKEMNLIMNVMELVCCYPVWPNGRLRGG